MGYEKEIVLFETEDKSIALPVSIESDTVWLSANQMSVLFGRDEKTIRKHIIGHYFIRSEKQNSSVISSRLSCFPFFSHISAVL